MFFPFLRCHRILLHYLLTIGIYWYPVPLHEAVEEVKDTYIYLDILEVMFTDIGDIHKDIY